MSDQLGRKDNRITQLNEVTQKQAVHIQSLIEENSKLNTKLLPKAIKKKTMVALLVTIPIGLIRSKLKVSIIKDTTAYKRTLNYKAYRD